MRPAKVKVMGRTFPIKYINGPPLDAGDNGRAEIDTMAIYVREGLEMQLERSTVLHETLHVISDLIGLRLTEKQIEGLETGIYQVNSDNPRFFASIRQTKESRKERALSGDVESTPVA